MGANDPLLNRLVMTISHDVAPLLAQEVELFGRLHTLGDDADGKRVGHGDSEPARI